MIKVAEELIKSSV